MELKNIKDQPYHSIEDHLSDKLQIELKADWKPVLQIDYIVQEYSLVPVKVYEKLPLVLLEKPKMINLPMRCVVTISKTEPSKIENHGMGYHFHLYSRSGKSRIGYTITAQNGIVYATRHGSKQKIDISKYIPKIRKSIDSQVKKLVNTYPEDQLLKPSPKKSVQLYEHNY